MRGIDTYTLNTVAGWILGTGLLVFGLNELANIVYHAEAPAQPGMVVEVAEAAPAADDAPADDVPHIAALLADADADRGQAAARACQACHTFDQGGAHRIGPNLWDIVGQSLAHLDNYAYSDAMQARSDETWTYEALNEFLANPRGAVPGTKMAYAGMRRDDQRADLIAYLRTLSDDPQPLPEPPALAAQAEMETPEAGAETEPALQVEDAPAEGAPAEEAPAEEASVEDASAEDASAEEASGGVAALIAEKDPEKGQAAARACAACHTFDQGGAHRVGPNLWDIVGQTIAHHEDYAYSDALQARSEETWTYELLDEFLANPRGFAPGTKMAYGGMRRDDQRHELIAYLRTLSEDPRPLP